MNGSTKIPESKHPAPQAVSRRSEPSASFTGVFAAELIVVLGILISAGVIVRLPELWQ